MEKQIQDLLERQTELKERRAALESSRVPCTLDTIFPDVLHCGAGTPRTPGRGPRLLRFEISPRNRFAPLREVESDAVIVSDSIVRYAPATLAKDTRNPEGRRERRRDRPGRGGERHQAAADGGSEEGLQQPDRGGSQHVAGDEDHRVRTASHVST
ncbi:hypothetical protein M9458_050976, partial [Cirrhinus mrigala]